MYTFEKKLMMEKYALIVNGCLLSIGLVGNITVLIVIVCSQSLRTLTDFYLLNLSITDLLNLITKGLGDSYYYYFIVSLPRQNAERKTGWSPNAYVFQNKAAHYVNIWLNRGSFYASMFTVTAFTIERYLAICHPFFVQSMSQTSRVKPILATVWSITALIALIFITLIVIATEEISPQFSMRALFIGILIIDSTCFVIPNLAITVMCIFIGRQLKRNCHERPTTLQANRSNTKTLKMFGIIILISFLSWIPNFMILLLTVCTTREETMENYYQIWYATEITVTLPATLNPIVYTIMSSKFREALKDLSSKTRKKLDYRTAVVTTAQTSESALEMG